LLAVLICYALEVKVFIFVRLEFSIV
jgi:hypothetical protein